MASATLETIVSNRIPCKSDREDGRVDVIAMSSSLLTDRMFIYTRFLEELSRRVCVKVWAGSALNPAFEQVWHSTHASVEGLPEVRAFREFYNYLRRVNEFVWDFRQQPPSRVSMMRRVTGRQQTALLRALKLPAQILSLARAERFMEDRLESLLLSYQRSEEAMRRLRTHRPEVLLTTGPFQFEQPGIVAAAKILGIPVLAFIPSWDNLSTKNRMVFKYDGYLVWSEQAREEIHHFYPQSRDVPVYVVGAPQFDIFFQERFSLSRAAFCSQVGLRPDRQIIVYALGSPNFLREHHGAVDLARRIARGELGDDVQMIVRPHPIHDNAELAGLFRQYAPRVILQHTAEPGVALTARSQGESQIVEWVNTFRHADVVVNLSSTVTVDAAIFDRPIVNLDYDPEPGHPNQALVKDVNHLWTHFKPVAESGGVWLVNNPEEMVDAIKTYLAHPELHREKRRWIADHVCGHLDGRCGYRMANAVLDFLQLKAAKVTLQNLKTKRFHLTTVKDIRRSAQIQ